MRARLITTIFLWFLIAVTLWLGGLIGGQILLLLAALGVLHEIISLVKKLKITLNEPALLISLFLILAGHFWHPVFLNASIGTSLALIITLLAHWRMDPRSLPVALGSLIVVSLGLGSLNAIATLPLRIPAGIPSGNSDLQSWHALGSILQAVWVIGVIKLSDAGAYLLGTHFGRQKLIPAISPGKTVEGFAGAILCGLIIGVMGAPLFPEPYFAPCLAAVLALVGAIGDLLASWLKRAAKVKDSSRMIPGIGGLLDLCDSLLLAAPVAYLAIRFWVQ
jgi:CDP-diglyceride synthetase